MSLLTNSKYGVVEYQVYPNCSDVDSLTVEVKFVVTGVARGDVGEEKLLKAAIRQMERSLGERIKAVSKTR